MAAFPSVDAQTPTPPVPSEAPGAQHPVLHPSSSLACGPRYLARTPAVSEGLSLAARRLIFALRSPGVVEPLRALRRSTLLDTPIGPRGSRTAGSPPHRKRLAVVSRRKCAE